MSNNISLTASMRSNLLSLQNIAGQVDLTQNRLSTGLKVNSAIDNPSSYYTAVSLNNRASDLSSLLDSMAQGIQTIKAANTALESASSFMVQAAATATQAINKNDYTDYPIAAIVTNADELAIAVEQNNDGLIVIDGTITLDDSYSIKLKAGQKLVGAGYLYGAQNRPAEISKIVMNTSEGKSALTIEEDNVFVSDIFFEYNTNMTADNATDSSAIHIRNAQNVTLQNINMELKTTDPDDDAYIHAGIWAEGNSIYTLTGTLEGKTFKNINAKISEHLIYNKDSTIMNMEALQADFDYSSKTDFKGPILNEDNVTVNIFNGSNLNFNSLALRSDASVRVNVKDTSQINIKIDLLGWENAIKGGQYHLSESSTINIDSSHTYGPGFSFASLIIEDNASFVAQRSNGKNDLSATVDNLTLKDNARFETNFSIVIGKTGDISGNSILNIYADKGITLDLDIKFNIRDNAVFNIRSENYAINTTIPVYNKDCTFNILSSTARVNLFSENNKLFSIEENGGIISLNMVAGSTISYYSTNEQKGVWKAEQGIVQQKITDGESFFSDIGLIKDPEQAPDDLADLDVTAVLTPSDIPSFTEEEIVQWQQKASDNLHKTYLDQQSFYEEENKNFNEIIRQYDNLINDASYKGINLLKGQNLTIIFNEDRSSGIEVSGVDLSSQNLQIQERVWKNVEDILANLEEINQGLEVVRQASVQFGNYYSIVTTRENFTQNLINVLTEGADKLTLADINEESANMLALQTRQQLAVNSLSLASQASQSILKLF